MSTRWIAAIVLVVSVVNLLLLLGVHTKIEWIVRELLRRGGRV